MPRRKKQSQSDETIETEGEERQELSNSATRAETIREACETIGELDRQIDGLKAERKAVIETRVVADLGMKKADFALAYKLYQLGQDERDTLQDTIRECFAALGIGEQLNWLDAAAETPLRPVPTKMDEEARRVGQENGAAGHRDNAARWPSGEYGHADYEIGHSQGLAERARSSLVADAAEG